jgi:hypothetical protein
MALGSIQPLTEESTSNISWRVRVASAYGRQIYHLYMPTVLKSESLNLMEPLGAFQACTGVALSCFTMPVTSNAGG